MTASHRTHMFRTNDLILRPVLEHNERRTLKNVLAVQAKGRDEWPA